jgi:hypothetical protein
MKLVLASSKKVEEENKTIPKLKITMEAAERRVDY